MNRKTTPTGEAWGQAMGFWFRLWQAQIDQSLKFWCVWAQALPRQSAAELSAEAEAMREIHNGTRPVKPRRTQRPEGAKATAPARRKSAATVH